MGEIKNNSENLQVALAVTEKQTELIKNSLLEV